MSNKPVKSAAASAQELIEAQALLGQPGQYRWWDSAGLTVDGQPRELSVVVMDTADRKLFCAVKDSGMTFTFKEPEAAKPAAEAPVDIEAPAAPEEPEPDVGEN